MLEIKEVITHRIDLDYMLEQAGLKFYELSKLTDTDSGYGWRIKNKKVVMSWNTWLKFKKCLKKHTELKGNKWNF